MIKSFLKLKQFLLERLEDLRQIVATHPKVVVWRLELFRFSPFLSKHSLKMVATLVVIFCFYTSFYIFSWRAPSPFPLDSLVTIERGEPLSQIATNFEAEGIIRSKFWLKTFIILLGGERRVVAGDYYFPEKVSVFKVARMLHKGQFGLIAIRTTIPEGLSSFEIGHLLEKTLPSFNGEQFIEEVDKNKLEGFLFPDTYFLMPNTKPSDLILMMRENFARQIQTYEEDLLKSGRTLEEIVIMASIIEGEASKSLEAKRIVSGILWKRLKLKMPLQVDAPFKYYNGKHSYTLTKDDLKEEHPYNTYVNLGLPPTAIGNPGIDSLRAAIAPTNTEYLYFMSDKSGNLYYARDFAGHQANRERYLR